jgi:lipoate---protein ligase
MKFLDLSFPAPAENLACDEALLDWREEDGGGGILRFWESPETFVVVGYANKIEAEVNVARCEAAQIPIRRRCSGGGTVLQGRGCLNYALILEMGGHPAFASISSANQYIMERHCVAMQAVAGNSLIIKVQGHTDLACASTLRPSSHTDPDHGRAALPRGHRTEQHIAPANSFRKFSGNSQRRHKHYLLFHGTFLLDFDLALVGEYLKFPSRQPEYRSSRSHGEFLTNLQVPAARVKDAMRRVWLAEQELLYPPLDRVSSLTREKYATREWNYKF